jgi:putative RNase toxin 28 of polymorphic toxin system
LTRVLIDPAGLERTARVLDHVADEYHGLARELHAFPSLPGPIGGWVDAERGRVAGGLYAQAGTLHSIASRLRERARGARMADAADGRDHRGKLPDRLPHWPLRPPPLQPPPAEAAPPPEDFLQWLREQIAVTPMPGRFSVAPRFMKATTSRGGTDAAIVLLGLLITVGALVVGGGLVEMSQSKPQDSSQSKPESVPTAVDTGARCTPQTTFDPDPLANYRKDLDTATLDAARRELRGEVVARKPDGTPFDHVGKVKDVQKGLKNTIARMQARLRQPSCSPAHRAEAERILSEASRLLDYSEKYVPSGS